MSEYEIKGRTMLNVDRSIVRNDGCVMCRDMTPGIARFILLALELQANLTPPEGIVASKESITADSCIVGEWYCICAEWFRCHRVTSTHTELKRLMDNEIEVISFEHIADHFYPALALDCTVGELESGEKCEIDGFPWTRSDRRASPTSWYMVYDNYQIKSFNEALACRRVPKEAE